MPAAYADPRPGGIADASFRTVWIDFENACVVSLALPNWERLEAPIADVDTRCDAEAMITFLALIAFQAVPSPPPPDAKMAAPALAFWNAQGITDAERRDWRDAARALLANELLDQAAEDWSRSPALRQQRLQVLIDRLQALLPYTSREENQRADLCAAGDLVGSLSSQELADVQTFFRSPPGRRFWLSSRIGEKRLIECYRIGMRGSIDAGATLRSIGVRPPAAWDGPPID